MDAEDRSRTCPICLDAEVEDMRHIAVECFYDVSEVAPEATRKPIFCEVPDDTAIWGVTRRYPAGTRDRFVTEDGGQTEGGTPLIRLRTVQDPIGGIRLAEKETYSLDCCKSCRGTFLTLFGAWSRGEHVRRSEPDEIHNIPVRQNGAIVYLSEEQFRQWEIDRSAGGRR
ncbi:hypothetical protein OMR07_15440 [Methylobacterium organophilum]|nr:hypothetical protein [Methylobacterium organophilum]